MRILVVGGTRSIGPRLVRRLMAAGHRVAVAHRGRHTAALPVGAEELLHEELGAPILRIPDILKRVEAEVVIPMMVMGEADAVAVLQAFVGSARRVVLPSSGDVYKAWALFARLEDGPVVPTPLREDSPLRSSRYPYRTPETPNNAIEYMYDKVLAEEALRSNAALPVTILRLPKVYGPDDNADLETVYGFRHAPGWRWTHGHAENAAKAIALAALDDRAIGRTYNVGEPYTPTIGERLRELPERPALPSSDAPSGDRFRFEQNVDYDTSRIRTELQFVESLDERRAMREQIESRGSEAPGGVHSK